MAFGLAIIGVLVGVGLGLRFKVLVLAPTIALAMMFATLVGIAQSDHLWSIAFNIVISTTALQLGYLAGILVRAAIE
jgi:hypothetical protein